MKDDVSYRVGDLVIDPGRGRVTRGETEVPLGKLSYDLLLVLVRSAPNLLTIDTLIDRVWPGLVVSPETVSQRVKLLRDALGDDPKAPRYIAGLRGRGYQIIAPVTEMPSERWPAPAPDRAVEMREKAGAASPTVSPPARAPHARWYRTGRGKYAMATLLLVLFAVGAVSWVKHAYGPGSGPRATGQVSPPPHSVAVMAFANLSGDPKDEYFSDGLSEELLDKLVRISALRVAARASSFSFKGKNADIATVGHKLNVAAVLDGSVRRAGERVRIRAELVNVGSGYHLWSQTYDRELKDIFELQTEIATAVAAAMRVTLLGERAVGGTRNPQAFDAYLRGRAAKAFQGQAGNHAALQAYDEAIRLDPDYALAYAERARTLVWDASAWVTDDRVTLSLNAEALAAAKRAVALAPESGQTLGSLGLVLGATTLNYAATDDAFRRALVAEPGNADVLLDYGRFAVAFGHADVMPDMDLLVTLNPLDSTAHVTRGIALYHLRRYADARISLQQSLSLGDNLISRYWLASDELALRHTSAAISLCEPYRSVRAYCQAILAVAYRLVNRKDDAEKMLSTLKTGEDAGFPYLSAAVYAQWGEPQRALQLLDVALRVQDGWLSDIRVDPLLDPVRETPQFRAIVASLNFPR